ncbi:acyltransferase [Sphingobium sp. Sx8-8]|uniref:acyltransferase family protein n=1 Tax=Sphingobium sp. Sx8-8 TaxID=2933617 RepID=UPI001F5988C5|nr:acyltransferase [Sphingobium sp. Sx8-8]
MLYTDAEEYRRAIPSERSRYDSVQYLRAFAALFVLLGHSMSAVTDLCSDGKCAFVRPKWATGSGVDLFFLISGFIMLISSKDLFQKRGSRTTFMSRRIIRILPLYWFATTMFVVISGLARNDVIDLRHIASSLLFYPWNPHANFSGITPVLSLGWTLNYEMMFYIIFSAFIYLQRTHALFWITFLLISIATLGHFIPQNAISIFFWSRPIILEFAAGMLLAELAIRRRVKLPSWARLILLAPLILLLWNPLPELRLARTPNELTRVIVWGGPMFCLLLAAISGPVPVPRIFERALSRLGDSSYSLYLLHPFCITATIILFQLFHKYYGTSLYPVPVLIAAIILSCTVAIASYSFFEKPFGAFLKDRIAVQRRRSDLPV